MGVLLMIITRGIQNINKRNGRIKMSQIQGIRFKVKAIRH